MSRVDVTDGDATRPWLNPRRVPAFHLDLRTGALAWTDGHSRLYGYPPDGPTPSMDLVYAHKHADDRPRLRRLMRRAVDDATGFVFVHRIVTRTGATLPVVTVVDAIAESSGRVVDVTGVTQPFDETTVQRDTTAPDDPDAVVSALVAEIAHLREGLVHRDQIGMAKGIIMAREKVTAERAFDRLVGASQRTNTKLREIARLVVETGLVPD